MIIINIYYHPLANRLNDFVYYVFAQKVVNFWYYSVESNEGKKTNRFLLVPEIPEVPEHVMRVQAMVNKPRILKHSLKDTVCSLYYELSGIMDMFLIYFLSDEKSLLFYVMML